MPEGVIAVLAVMVAIGAREWRRVQLAREKRREREQELLAEMVADVAGGEREVQVHHGGVAGTWSLTGTMPPVRCTGKRPLSVGRPWTGVRSRRGGAGDPAGPFTCGARSRCGRAVRADRREPGGR